MDKDYVINDEQIIIKTPIPFKTLVEMEICHNINRHATINLSVIANVENQREILHTDWSAANNFEKVNGAEDVIDLYACSGVPKIANGSTTIALSEVMDGKKESESSFPEAFKSMDNYTVKGGYILPEEEKEDDHI